MYEINKKSVFDDLMEDIYGLVTICGGWDDECRNVKPGVQEQIDRIRRLAQEGLEQATDCDIS
jgi:hypothetical protein